MSERKIEIDFKLLRDHCITIRRDYNTYTTLFNEENRDILDKAASFFTDVAEIMHRDWILQACKIIVDPASITHKKEELENITLDLVNKQLKNEGLYNEEIASLSAKIKLYGDKIKPARDKRLAHYDRDHQINGITLGATTETELHDFLLNIQEYCDEVGIAIGVGPLDFSCSACQGDILDLLMFIKKSVIQGHYTQPTKSPTHSLATKKPAFTLFIPA